MVRAYETLEISLLIMIECLKSLQARASNNRRHGIDEAKPYTGAWLFNSESYRKWKGSSTSSILSIQGKPGSGKSTLLKQMLNSLLLEHNLKNAYDAIDNSADSLVDVQTDDLQHGTMRWEERLTQSRIVIASYFFHVRGRETSHSDMLQSMLYQILKQDDRLYPAFRETYRKLRDKQETHIEWAFEDLKSIFRAVACFRDCPDKFYFLIDALDESDLTKVENILTLFHHDLKGSPRVIKTVLASRPLRGFDNDSLGSIHKILEKENKADITYFIDSEMDFLLSDPRNPDEESRKELFESVTGYLKEYARGVFLWVVLISRELREYARDGYSPSLLNQKLQKLPKDLEGFYQLIIKRLAGDMDRETKIEAQKTLNWVTLLNGLSR
jgi:hypothetical protein